MIPTTWRIGRIGSIAAASAILISGAGLYLYFARAPASPPAARGRPGVPVSVAVANRQDVPIYLTGIGTLQAYFTIDIYAKVDGELQEVLFTEGQHVRKGDVLAKIDPRLYRAALDQAKAKRAQDAAMLLGAEKDLARATTLALNKADTQQNVDQLQSKADQLKAAILADEAMIETRTASCWSTSRSRPSATALSRRMRSGRRACCASARS
jgi:multidrug efflux system membrane fusion protein